MTDHTLDFPAAGAGTAPASPAARFFDRLLDWLERAQHRQALAGLTDVELKDIGLSRADVEAEANKPFWRA